MLFHDIIAFDHLQNQIILFSNVQINEGMELKKEVFKELDQVAKPDAILATNTSTLDLDEIA